MIRHTSLILVHLIMLFFISETKPVISAEVKNSNDTDPIYCWLTRLQQPNGLLPSSEKGERVSLYDNALAALAFTAFGDYKRAEKIFDFFNSRLKSEMLISPGGFAQMRNLNGIPLDNQPRRWLGDNAWLLIAVNNYNHVANNTKYRKLARALTNWIISQQDTDGGVWGGYDANGNRISKIAEGNIDAFNAVSGYTSFHEKLLTYFKDVRWDTTDQLIIAWAEYPQYKYALDLHPWGYCAFEDFPETVLDKADRYLNTQTSTATQKLITGYCFDEDKDVVWLEGTGQMAVAFLKSGREDLAHKYLSEMKKGLIASSPFPGCYALPYTTNFASSYADDVLWEGVDTAPVVSSTAWYLFAAKRFDPLLLGSKKNIPEKDKFWKQSLQERE